MILHDPYAGNRKWWSYFMYDEKYDPGPNDKDWTTWDYVLADVFQIISDYTNQHGQLYWYDESEDVTWVTEETYSGYGEAVERARDKQEKRKPGYDFIAYPEFRDPEKKPTMREWAAKKAADKDEKGVYLEQPRGGPPSAADLAAMKEAGY